jgi:hypothetical protein
MKKIRKIFCFLLVLVCVNNAYALGAVSRACQFSTIPTGMKSLAATFFIDLGADSSISQLPWQDASQQQAYWINESLTTDYFSVRYYLWALAEVYALKGPNSTYAGNWQFYTRYLSSSVDWVPKTVSGDLKSDQNFAIYFANRGMLYSARAGNPKIGEFLYYDYNGNLRYVVTGYHWYYDPVSKVSGQLVKTRAQDCNLQNWGQDTGLWDR